MYQQSGTGSFGNSIFQPGFAGTSPQQVRQEIGQSYGQGWQQQPYQQQSQPSVAGGVFQPGFASSAQQVRQDIAQDGGYRLAQYQQQPFNQTGSVFQPGFAGTTPQQVRQDIGQSVGYMF